MSALKVLGLALIVASSAAMAFDEPEDAAVWGVKELKEAATAATETVRQKLGQAAYDGINGFSIDKNVQGNAGKAKVTYKVGGETKSVSYFCHTHENDIDCH